MAPEDDPAEEYEAELRSEFARRDAKIERLQAERDELLAAMKSVLERDSLFSPSGMINDCRCIDVSRETEQEYEADRCPHQIARAILAKVTWEPTS